MENVIEFIYDTFIYLIYALALAVFLLMLSSMQRAFDTFNSYNIDMYYSTTQSNEIIDNNIYGYEIVNQFNNDSVKIGKIYVDKQLLNNDTLRTIELQGTYTKEEYINSNDILITEYEREQ